MPFRFRFRSLLKQREFRRDRAQNALAQAQRELRALEEKRAAFKEAMEDYRNDLEKRQRSGIALNEFLSFQDGLAALERQLLSLEVKIRQAGREVDKKQKELLDCEKEVKKFECLEENDRREYIYQRAKKEQEHLDQISVIKEFHHRHETGR